MRDHLTELAAFATIAEERSFTRAATRLQVSSSALSHAMRGLEERLGVRLLARTTRSVAPTEAGERLLARLRPALDEIAGALDDLGRLRDRPAGRLRLSVPRIAAMLAIGSALGRFARDYPDVTLELTLEEGLTDIVAGRFDAGVRLGEQVERDMVAVRISRDQRAAVVGTPGYLASRQVPRAPRDLRGHLCINHRLFAGGLYRWEFEKDGQALEVVVDGPLVLNDAELTVHAALDGIGLAYAFEDHVAPHLAAGRLVRVLEDWCPSFPGFFLYYPSRRQMPAALAALVSTLRVARG